MITSLDQKHIQLLQRILQQYPLVNTIVQAIHQHGGRALLVGGAVRDILLGLAVKDLDIEVHHIPLHTLETIMHTFGPVSNVGKVYGVLRIAGLDIDWSLPRADSSGRKPDVVIDPYMTLQEAFRRRDVTINAMGIDLITHELLDPFNGQHDLATGILRATDPELFIEDPLRFFRVMHFIGRFALQPDEILTRICATMDLSGISVERIAIEFEKLLLRSTQPSLGVRWLHTIGRLKEVLPELADTIGVEQSPQWHPEGDVFEHSMQALDAAAVQVHDDQAIRLIVLYAALCHDLGKVTTTRRLNDRIISYGHDQKGVPLARKLLRRVTRKKDLIDAVAQLVRHHMAPAQFIAHNAKPPAYKRLAHKLTPPVTLSLLVDLSLADRQGRNPQRGYPLLEPCPDIDLFKHKAAHCKVLVQKEEPILLGRDLLDVVQPGKDMGNLLRKAYHIQINESVTDKKELKRRVIHIARK